MKKHKAKFDLKRIVFLGRLYREYLDMFDLNDSDLENRRILDCPGGASSFTREACERGFDCRAVDKIYNEPLEKLNSISNRDIEESFKDAMQTKGLVSSDDKSKLIKERLENCHSAYALFSSDYAKHGNTRYIFGKLPDNIPFEDNSFDLVLSSNFLFAYQDHLDFVFHVNAISELLRITKDELRIYPTAGMDGSRYKYLNKIIDMLEDRNCSVKYGDTRNNFVEQWDQFLLIKKSKRDV